LYNGFIEHKTSIALTHIADQNLLKNSIRVFQKSLKSCKNVDHTSSLKPDHAYA